MRPFEIFALRAARRELVAELRGEILEIGCGTGANFPHYGEPQNLTATEPDPDMFRFSQACCPEETALENWSAEELPLPDHSVTHVVSTLVFCSVGNLERTFQELKRVLKPGGTLHLIEHVKGNGVPGRLHELCTPVWSRICGGCHLNRETLVAAEKHGFERAESRTLFNFIGTPFVFARLTSR